MDYEKFLETVCEELQGRLPGMEVTIQDVEKLQGESYRGISILPEGGHTAVTFNLTGLYEQLQDGMSMQVVLDQVMERAREAINKMPTFDARALSDYETMKHKIIMQAVSTEMNREKLETIPHKEIGDMSIVYRFDLDHQTGGGDATVLITNQMLEGYGITPEQLMADADFLVPLRKPVVIRPLGEVIAEMLGVEGTEVSDDPSLLVATVPEAVNGAGVLGYPLFFEQAAEAAGGSYYLLPSSVHEVLLLPDDNSVQVQELNNMISSINETEVKPEERLADEAYHYDAKAQIFEKATVYEERKQAAWERIAGSVNEPAPNYEAEQAPEKMTVLMVEPDRYPRQAEIGTELEDLQAAVGGYIEVIYPFDDPVGLVMNEEGKINGLPLNRALRDDQGELYDVVAGPFMVVGLTEDGFGSLTQEQVQKYDDLFHQPELIVKMGKGIMALPLPDEMVKYLAPETDMATAGKEAKAAHREHADRDER